MGAVYVLGNPSARGGRERLDTVIGALRKRGLDAAEVGGASMAEALDAARAVVRGGADRLLAVGGDGVVSVAVNSVAESATVVGVVPDGTGNDFARALGLLDGDLQAQVERALEEPSRVDAIRTDHGWVATVATLGFSGDVTARANALRWPRGQFRYTVATLLQLPRLRTIPISATLDGRRLDHDTTLLAVGNTSFFGGGMRICPDARTDDGRLQLVSIGDVPRRTFLRVFPSVFSGRHVKRSEVTTDAGTVVTLDAAHGSAEVDLWADGEVLGPLPVTLELVPGALHVAGVRAD
ncbi:MAG: diacylglycerol kinase family protein [Actinomycetota bacterium]